MLENILFTIVIPFLNAGECFVAIVMPLEIACEYFVGYFLAISECWRLFCWLLACH